MQHHRILRANPGQTTINPSHVPLRSESLPFLTEKNQITLTRFAALRSVLAHLPFV